VRKDLKKIREIIIAEALNEFPPSDFESEDDIEEESDKYFFKRCERIEFNKE